MSREDAFQVEGVVIEALANGTWRVELKNGHRLLAFASARAREKIGTLCPAQKVRLKLSSYDLSTGRILDKATI